MAVNKVLPDYMMKNVILVLSLWLCGVSGCAQSSDQSKKTAAAEVNSMEKVEKSDEEWKKILTPEQYYVLRQQGTEAAFTGDYYHQKAKGTYVCAACGNELFSSVAKYNSGTGWPSFYEPITESKVGTEKDRSYGMVRTEVHCAKCGGHLGHIFDDGPRPTGLRYCINSVSLDFVANPDVAK